MRHLFVSPTLRCRRLACLRTAHRLHEAARDAQHFIIESTGGKHGDSWIWADGNGNRRGRESMNLRGQVFELDSRAKREPTACLDVPGPRRHSARRCGGDVHDYGGRRTMEESGRRRDRGLFGARRFTSRRADRSTLTAWILETLLARPDKSLDLLPGGKAHAAKLTDLAVGDWRRQADHHALGDHRHPYLSAADLGRREQQILRHVIRDRLAAGGLRGRTGEDRGGAGESAGGAGARDWSTLLTAPRGPVALRGVRLFDADATRFLDDQTVVVDKGVIAAVGARPSVAVPAGAQVIEGAAKL